MNYGILQVIISSVFYKIFVGKIQGKSSVSCDTVG